MAKPPPNNNKSQNANNSVMAKPPSINNNLRTARLEGQSWDHLTQVPRPLNPQLPSFTTTTSTSPSVVAPTSKSVMSLIPTQALHPGRGRGERGVLRAGTRGNGDNYVATKRSPSSVTSIERHTRSAKVWFVCGYDVLCYVRSDSKPSYPQYDTFGGEMDRGDANSYILCARRELGEEAVIHPAWLKAVEVAYASHSKGHYNMDIHPRKLNHAAAHWFVAVPSILPLPTLTGQGAREARSGTLAWRRMIDVLLNFHSFGFLQPLARVFIDAVSMAVSRAAGETNVFVQSTSNRIIPAAQLDAQSARESSACKWLAVTFASYGGITDVEGCARVVYANHPDSALSMHAELLDGDGKRATEWADQMAAEMLTEQQENDAAEDRLAQSKASDGLVQRRDTGGPDSCIEDGSTCRRTGHVLDADVAAAPGEEAFGPEGSLRATSGDAVEDPSYAVARSRAGRGTPVGEAEMTTADNTAHSESHLGGLQGGATKMGDGVPEKLPLMREPDVKRINSNDGVAEIIAAAKWVPEADWLRAKLLARLQKGGKVEDPEAFTDTLMWNEFGEMQAAAQAGGQAFETYVHDNEAARAYDERQDRRRVVSAADLVDSEPVTSPPPIPRCAVCGVDPRCVIGDILSCPYCGQILCPDHFPPEMHEPCRSSPANVNEAEYAVPKHSETFEALDQSTYGLLRPLVKARSLGGGTAPDPRFCSMDTRVNLGETVIDASIIRPTAGASRHHYHQAHLPTKLARDPVVTRRVAMVSNPDSMVTKHLRAQRQQDHSFYRSKPRQVPTTEYIPVVSMAVICNRPEGLSILMTMSKPTGSSDLKCEIPSMEMDKHASKPEALGKLLERKLPPSKALRRGVRKAMSLFSIGKQIPGEACDLFRAPHHSTASIVLTWTIPLSLKDSTHWADSHGELGPEAKYMWVELSRCFDHLETLPATQVQACSLKQSLGRYCEWFKNEMPTDPYQLRFPRVADQQQLSRACISTGHQPHHLAIIEPWLRDVQHRCENKRASRYSSPSLGLSPQSAILVAALEATPEANDGTFLQIRRLAEERANRRGVQRVSPRDVRDAATSLLSEKATAQNEHPPLDGLQLNQLDTILAEVKTQVDAAVADGCPRPRVLMLGERTGMAARRWRQAGAEVVTNDLEESEEATILHAQVPAPLVQDLGFDFVYGCPPCDYLSNAGVSRLHIEEGRFEAMEEAVTTFRSWHRSSSPLVTMESSKMHPYARRLLGMSPSEVVRPFEHGHREGKSICLYKVGPLPPLKTTFFVEGRDRRLANLAPGLGRGASRGRSFDGVMAAMASQWMGAVLDAARRRKVGNDLRSAEELLASAPGLHPSVALVYTPRKSMSCAGRLTLATVRSLSDTKLASVDVESKTREAETRLRASGTIAALEASFGMGIVAAVDPSLGVRLREEDPPQHAMPETREFRCKRGVWYAWAPRVTEEHAGGSDNPKQSKHPSSLFSWKKLSKEGQSSCNVTRHGLSHGREDCQSLAIPKKSAPRKKFNPSDPVMESGSEAAETVAKAQTSARKAAKLVQPKTTFWPERLNKATQGLASLNTTSVAKVIDWAAVIDYPAAFATACEGVGVDDTTSIDVITTYGSVWADALKALVRAINRKLLSPSAKQQKQLLSFLRYWDHDDRLYLRAKFPSLSSTVDLLRAANSRIEKDSAPLEKWCPIATCGRACESMCRNNTPVTCAAWSCVSESCSSASDGVCECKLAPLPHAIAMEPPTRPHRDTFLFGLHRREDGSDGIRDALPLWSTSCPFSDPREGDLCERPPYRSVGQYLAVQRSRVMGDATAYESYLNGTSINASEMHASAHSRQDPHNGVDRWEAVKAQWALYATFLKVSQHPSLDGALQVLPEFLAEVWPDDLEWGIEEPTSKDPTWSGGNLSGKTLMLVRAVLRGELPEPTPPQLMCEACGQLDRRPGGRCSECHCSVDELEGCLICGQMLCERCYPTSQHRQCHGPRGPNTSKPEHAVLFGLPPCCVPHASRLGRTMMSKMANEHPVAADWPPEPPHGDDVSKWTAIDRCQSCSNTRDRCFRGIQCDDCGEKPPSPSLSIQNDAAPLGRRTLTKLEQHFVSSGILAPLLTAKATPSDFNEPDLAAAFTSITQFSKLVELLPEGVLGTSGELPRSTSQSACITDPAGLPYIQQHGPKGAKGASGAIYNFIGLSAKSNFPTSVRKAVKAEGDAAYQRYGLHHVVHVIGPDLRGENPTANSEDQVIERLKLAYSNVLSAWLKSGLPCLRLLPISGGIFSGQYTTVMPRLSCTALHNAVGAMSGVELATLRERLQTADGQRPVQLCVYNSLEFSAFEEAMLHVDVEGLKPATTASIPAFTVASVEAVTQELLSRSALCASEAEAEDESDLPPSWSELRELQWQGVVLDEIEGYLQKLQPGQSRTIKDDDEASEAITELASLERCPESATFDESDISDESSPSAMPACCAYFEDFRIATRSSPSQMSQGTSRSYRVGGARWLSSIADSGSGNNVVSTQVLQELPDDAAVEFVARPPQVLLRSANGQDVVVNGKATICFTLNGYPFRDTFMVIDKGELCILGNEFIAKRGGVIRPSLHLNAESKGSVRLRHQSAADGWMEATIVSSPHQLSQADVDVVASVEREVTLVTKFVLQAPDRTIFCWRRQQCDDGVAPETFDFPGGKAAIGETHAEAGLRELQEKLSPTSFDSIVDKVKEVMAEFPGGSISETYTSPSKQQHNMRVWVVPLKEQLDLRPAEPNKHSVPRWRHRHMVLSSLGKPGRERLNQLHEPLTAYGEVIAKALEERRWFNQDVASLSSFKPSADFLQQEVARFSAGGDATQDSDSIPATSQYDVGPELDACSGGEIEGTLPAVPTGGKLAAEQKIKEFEYLLFHVTPIVIPAKTQTTVMLPAPKRLLDFEGPLLIEPAPDRVRFKSHLLTAYGISHVVNGKIAVQVINNTHQPDSLPSLAPIAMVRGETITVVDKAPDTDPTGNLTPEYKEAIANLHVDGICKKGCESCDLLAERRLTPEQSVEVYRLLAKRAHAFAVPPYKTPGQSHAIEVELPLKENARPFKCAASRVGDEGNKIIAKAVEDMERHHIIEKSNSPWASRVVLVKKKDGQPRFCVDLRRLNELLLVEDSPLPRCDDAIDQLGRATAKMSGAVHYHTLDLTAGFWALNIKPEHRERTAFVTNMGKWHFRRLPFGLRSGPSYMQRLMESTLQGLSWDICLPYLDDVAIWASGDTPEAAFEQSLERLDLVLERLEWAGLTCKPTKCTLFASKVEYLGHVCSREGVSLDPKKIQGIQDIDADSIDSLSKVRSFLGICGYYRRHVESYHVKSAPLVALTKSGVVFPEAARDPDVKTAIEELKTALCANPVLAYPRSDREFVVKSDAATGHGIGAVLIQRDDPDEEGQPGQERPVGYYGRKFTSHEQNYSATEAELLGVVEAIKQFRPYLWGRRFRVVTDHAALRWLHTMNGTQEGGPQSRLTRWVIKLQEYNFYVEHKPGKHHVDCDAISRLVGALTVVNARPSSAHSQCTEKEAEALMYPLTSSTTGDVQTHSEIAKSSRGLLDSRAAGGDAFGSEGSSRATSGDAVEDPSYAVARSRAGRGTPVGEAEMTTADNTAHSESHLGGLQGEATKVGGGVPEKLPLMQEPDAKHIVSMKSAVGIARRDVMAPLLASSEASTRIRKVPARPKVREDSPMTQFFKPLPLEEGGVPNETTREVPQEQDGSAATASDVKALQREDKKCLAIMTFLTSGVVPSEAKMAAFVRQHARHCTIEDGTLFRVIRLHPDGENENELNLLWIPESCQQAYLHAFHDQMGHQGRERTWQALRRQVFWPSSYQDVAEHVMRCHECSFSKQHRAVSRGIVPAIGSYPFDLVTVDLVDMVYAKLESSKGYCKCLIFVDSLSRWVEAIPLKADPTAEEYVRLFNEYVVCRYGVPRALRSDRGGNLSAVIVAAVNAAAGTQMLVSKAYHHESAASVERFNKTLEEMVRTVDPGGARWEEWLPFLLFSYRATPHRVTSESPAYLLYGRELRGPSDAVLDTRGLLASSRQSAEATVRRLRVAWRLAEAATLKQQVADKSDRDRKTEKPPVFQPDDRVLVKRDKLQPKLESLYDGPYRVVSGPDIRGNYKIRDLHTARMHDEVAVSRLKLYSTITDVDRIAPDEYLVESLLETKEKPLLNRGLSSAKVPHFLVKWRGYPIKDATWEPRSALMLRCSDMVQAFEETRGRRTNTVRAPQSLAQSESPLPVGPEEDVVQSSVEVPAPEASEPPSYAIVNREQRNSCRTGSRSSRLAAQPRKSYDESKRRTATVASLSLLDHVGKGPSPRVRSTTAKKLRIALAPRSEWVAGRWWRRVDHRSMPTTPRALLSNFWIPIVEPVCLMTSTDTLSSIPTLKAVRLVGSLAVGDADQVRVVFYSSEKTYFSWYNRLSDGRLSSLSFPGGSVETVDHFYSSQGGVDIEETYLQACHRLLQTQLVCYPWAIRELVEGVVLRSPKGHRVVNGSEPHSRSCKVWLVSVPDLFDAAPRDPVTHVEAKWRTVPQLSSSLSLPSFDEWDMRSLVEHGLRYQPDRPLAIDVLAVVSGPSFLPVNGKQLMSMVANCVACQAPNLQRCTGCLRGTCCQPNPSCVVCCGLTTHERKRPTQGQALGVEYKDPGHSSKQRRASAGNTPVLDRVAKASYAGDPHSHAADAMASMATGSGSAELESSIDPTADYLGQRVSESPTSWAQRASATLSQVLGLIKSGLAMSPEGKLSVVNPAIIRQPQDKASTLSVLEPFVGSQCLRETKAQQALCAVLARVVWPEVLSTDKAAGQAWDPPVNPRSITRWNRKIRDLNGAICEAAGLDLRTVMKADGFKAITATGSLQLSTAMVGLNIPLKSDPTSASLSTVPMPSIPPTLFHAVTPSPTIPSSVLAPVGQSSPVDGPQLLEGILGASKGELESTLPLWPFLEPALRLIQDKEKTVDARLENRAFSRYLAEKAGESCYVLATSNERKLVLRVGWKAYHASFDAAYRVHRRALVPASWCSSDVSADIQRFYEDSFYHHKRLPVAERSVVTFGVELVRVIS